MALNSLKPISLCILVTFFSFATSKAKGADFLYRFCSDDRSSGNGTYPMNLRTRLSSLSSKASDKRFDVEPVPATNSSDTVYGLFMCRGDVLPQACKDCVANATQTLSSDTNCSLAKWGVIWYEECMVRYSNDSFFSTVDTSPAFFKWNLANISSNSTSSFMTSLDATMMETANQAAKSSNRYSTRQENLSGFQTLYCLAQYELYPFYRVSDAQIGLVPETKYAHTDSEYSEDPGYISYNCSNNKADAAFQSNLRTLLSDMSSNGTSQNGFQTLEKTAYGLFRCRDDITLGLCGQCIQNATDKIASLCGLASTEAVIWYNHCWLRYSDRDFFSSADTSPRFWDLNISNTNPIQSSVASELSNKLDEVATKTGNSNTKYQTESLRLNDKQTVYILAQCSSGLSTNSCVGCLSDVIGMAIPWGSLGSVGGRVLYPSCFLRFELFQFYNLVLTTANPPPPDSKPEKVLSCGYMSPEYAMFGQFSEKSDVYSFGVVVLEIISGKKNTSPHEPHRVADGLLNFVWRHWRDETALSILDPKLKEKYGGDVEVMRCIQMGLLCVQDSPDARPTMLTIVSYLSSHTIELPSPREPTFFLHQRMDPIVTHESSSGQAPNSSTPSSINEISISGFYPR
ncbi:unnamed protein product [Sphenostylis stenocarpa]|uniref:Gnk2-homologous domain-containing protein n=1 Tax=Sphenostylis stenocarpa TaxID=92480 RepID=A0AA86S0E0_9FABA|nr:unnamed protein product [Sphenostylis stenocarpa]